MSVTHLSPAAKRWQEVVNDPQLSERVERIETDARGQVIMAPPPDFIHRSQAKQIQSHLDQLLGQARALTEQPIETDIGAVKIADVVWLTREQCQQLRQEPNVPLQPAPPICVEIISPSNTVQQMNEKRAAYFAIGAKEVWICEREGRMRFFDPAGEISQSRLVPQFPKEISIDQVFDETREPLPSRRSQVRTKLPPEREPGTSRAAHDPPSHDR